MKKSLLYKLSLLCLLLALTAVCKPVQAQLSPPDTTQWHISELSSPDAIFPIVQQRANAYFDAHPEMDSINPLEKLAYKRWEYFWQNRANINGASVQGKLSNVLNAMNDPSKLLFEQDLNSLSLSSEWILISPDELVTQNLGTVTAIWSKPNDEKLILIGTETSGLWKTTDGGINWVNITDGYAMANTTYITAAGFGVSSIAVNPANFNEIYIATYLPNTELVLGHGANILKSIDGGATWNPLSSYNAFINLTDIYYKSMVWKIVFDNNNIYAAIGKKLVAFNSTAGSTQYSVVFELGINSPNPSNPSQIEISTLYPYSIYRKIRDFELIIINNDTDRKICLTTDGIKDDVKAQAEVYHTIHNKNPFNGIPYIWTRKDLPLNYNGFIDNAAIAVYNSEFYIAYDEKTTLGLTQANAFFNIDILNTSSNTLTNIFMNPHFLYMDYPENVLTQYCSLFNGFGYRYDAFEIANTNTMYVGGFDIFKIDFSQTPAVTSSITYYEQAAAVNQLGFENFNKNSYCHNGIRTIKMLEFNNEYSNFLVGNEGGISKYTGKFSNINGNGLSITQFTNITSTQHNQSDVIVAGSLRNGLWYYDDAKWRQYYWEDGGNSLINDNNPNIIFNCTHFWDASYPGSTHLYGGSFLRTYNSLSPVICPVGNHDAFVCPSLLYINEPSGGGFCGYFPPLEFHPTNTQKLYLGKHDVLESSNNGTNWTNISNIVQDYWSRELQAVKVAPSNPTIMYIAYANPTWGLDADGTNPNATPGKKLYKGIKIFSIWNWTDITENVNLAPSAYTLIYNGISDIAINPIDDSEIWITLNQFCSYNAQDGKERVMHSTDYGATFTEYSQGLTPAPVNCIKYYYNNGNSLLFIGTDVGVFYRDPTDNSATWKLLNSGGNPIPRCIVTDIEISYKTNKLRVATLGRGIWETEIFCFPTPTANEMKCVNSDETWVDDIAYGDIDVHSPATLTIKSHVKISGNGHVRVDKGATLILDGGTLEACPGQMWGGIKLFGNYLESQFNEGEHGKIIIQNNGTIKDALIGINCTNPDFNINSEKGGGIIETDISANFINNQIAILMNPYQNRDPVNTNVIVKDRSYLTNCRFIKNNGYHDPVNYPFKRFIEMNGIDRINIDNCTFERNTLELPTLFITGAEGIKSTNSVFTLINSNFHNLGYGVMANFTNPAMRITVKNCNFDNNFYGALVMGTNNVLFTSNTFKIPDQLLTFFFPGPWGGINVSFAFGWGLYLDGCKSGYIIEGNTFINSNGPNMHGNIGMVVNNSTAPVKTVYNNTFTNLKYGFLAQQDNGGSAGYDYGLKIKCNDFRNCNIRDIAVTGFNPPGISMAQGADLGGTSPAGNTFSHLGPITFPTDFDNEAINNPIYYHHQDQGDPSNLWIPNYYYKISPTSILSSIIYTKATACPSIAVITGPVGPDLPFDPGALNVEISNAKLQLNSAKLILQIWVDGGNTEGLQQTVELSYPWEAYVLYNELLSLSPYLSDEVLINAIENEVGLPPLMLKLILLANPQAVRSTRVMDALYKRINPFPEEWIDELKLGLDVVSPRNELEANVGYYAQQRQVYFDMLKAYYLSDTIELAYDSLVNLLANSGNVDDAYELAFSHFSNGLTDEASNLMADIPMIYNLIKDEELQLYNQSNFYLELLKNLKEKNYILGDMGTEYLDWISATTESPEYNYFTANARALRMLYDTSYHFTEPVWLPEDSEFKMSKPSKNKTIASAFNNKINLSPNPANDYFILNYSFKEELNNASAEIYDATGRKINSIGIFSKTDQLLIKCSDYVNGQYYCIIRNNNKIVCTLKFNVTH